MIRELPDYLAVTNIIVGSPTDVTGLRRSSTMILPFFNFPLSQRSFSRDARVNLWGGFRKKMGIFMGWLQKENDLK